MDAMCYAIRPQDRVLQHRKKPSHILAYAGGLKITRFERKTHLPHGTAFYIPNLRFVGAIGEVAKNNKVNLCLGAGPRHNVLFARSSFTLHASVGRHIDSTVFGQRFDLLKNFLCSASNSPIVLEDV